MKKFEKIIPAIVVLFNVVIYTDAQTAATSVTKGFIFSAIVNVGEEASVKEGRLLLQSEYAEIYYRNPRIKEL